MIDVHTHIGQNDPDGFTCTTAGADRRPGARSAPAAWCSRCRSPAATRRPTTWSSPRPQGSATAADAVPAPGPGGRAAGRGRARPGRRRPGHQAPPARRVVRARPPRAGRRVRAGRRAAACRCWCTPAAASRRWAATRWSICAAPPGPAADPGPRLHHRPVLDLARGAPTCPTCSSTPRGGRPATCWRCGRWSRPVRSCSPATRPTARPAFAADHQPALRAPGRAERRRRSGWPSAARRRACWPARTRSTRARRTGDAVDGRPAAGPRVHLPGGGDRARRFRARSPAELLALAALGLRRGRRRAPGRGVRRRCVSLLDMRERASCARATRTAGPQRFAPGFSC